MNIFDRLGYAFISGFFGALIGLAGWWLYGAAYSLNYSGSAMDPVLRHWLIGCIAVFAVLGFVFKEQAADFVGDTINDMNFAHNGGAIAVGVLSGVSSREQLAPAADYILDSVADVPALIRQLEQKGL